MSEPVLTQSPTKRKQCKKSDHPVQEKVVLLPDVPDHVVYSVLIQLPVLVLSRFLCLSKQWNAIMQTRSFGADLLKMQSTQEPQVTCVVLIPNDSCASLVKLCDDQNGEVLSKYTRLEFPFWTCGDSDIWISKYSCDGIFCLICERMVTSLDSTTEIVLWNPITGKFKVVPWPSDDLLPYYGVSTFVGFGYDPTMCDYKIVVLSFLSGKNIIRVRSLKSGVWRTVETSTTCHWLFRGHGIFEPVVVGEDVYWLGNNMDDKSFSLLKFSLVEEKLTTILYPCVKIDKILFLRLGKFSGSLYAYGVFRYGNEKFVEVWKYSKLGNTMNWEKLLILPNGSLFQDFQMVDCFVLLGFTSNGNLLFNVGDAFITYDPRKNIRGNLKENKDILPNKFIYGHIHLLEMETMISP